jgi:hypothetical protein
MTTILEYEKRMSVKGRRVLCKYDRLLVDKVGLPIFLSFKPDNHLVLVLKSDVSSDKIKELLQVISKWFASLKVIDWNYSENHK